MSPMALVLVGQTELWDKLKPQRYAAVRQHIDINCVLPHLNRSETEQYIQSHLKYADGRQNLFIGKALDDIYRESAGILRNINRISEKCLMYAFQQNKRLIDEHIVRYVVDHEMLKGGADSFWNLERLSSTKLKKVDTCSVAYALVELSKCVNI